jgi:hypothetical protein
MGKLIFIILNLQYFISQIQQKTKLISSLKKEASNEKNQKPTMDKGKIIIYQTPDGITQLDVKLENETVWINRQQMAELFERDIKTVGKHINNALKEELIEVPVVAKFATTATNGKICQNGGSPHFPLSLGQAQLIHK